MKIDNQELEINKKLDWIAYRLMRLTITLGEGMNGTEVEEYSKLFGKDKETRLLH